MPEHSLPGEAAALASPEPDDIAALIATAKRERARAIRAFAVQALARLRLTGISLFAPIVGWQRQQWAARPAPRLTTQRLPRSA